MSEFEPGMTEGREREIYSRLAQEFSDKKLQLSEGIERDLKMDRELHGEQSGTYHINQKQVTALEGMIDTLVEGKDRKMVIRWLIRKIDLGKEKGEDTAQDETDLDFLNSLESGFPMEQKKAA
jgi:hypothetical protein